MLHQIALWVSAHPAVRFCLQGLFVALLGVLAWPLYRRAQREDAAMSEAERDEEWRRNQW